MKKIFIAFSLIAFFSSNAQDTITTHKKAVKHFNLIKTGVSVQNDIMTNNRYDYGFYYDYRPREYYHEGPNTKVFAGFEHIWEYQNKKAVALEPIAGISIHNNSIHAFVGNNAKFYWISRDKFRMGVAIFAGYSYSKHKTSIATPMDGGNYYQRMDIDMNYHQVNGNISIIPFQFRLGDSPIVIESQLAMFGINFMKERSANFEESSTTETHYQDFYVNPYLFKAELKIGFILP